MGGYIKKYMHVYGVHVLKVVKPFRQNTTVKFQNTTKNSFLNYNNLKNSS